MNWNVVILQSLHIFELYAAVLSSKMSFKTCVCLIKIHLEIHILKKEIMYLNTDSNGIFKSTD